MGLLLLTQPPDALTNTSCMAGVCLVENTRMLCLSHHFKSCQLQAVANFHSSASQALGCDLKMIQNVI